METNKDNKGMPIEPSQASTLMAAFAIIGVIVGAIMLGVFIFLS